MAERGHPREPLLLLEEVAAICRAKATKTVRSWIKAGIRGERLPASRLGRQWRVHPDDLAAFLKKTRQWSK
jgi:excisionase family DNA binding protein